MSRHDENKKGHRDDDLFNFQNLAGSDGFLNLSRFQARSAYPYAFHGSIDDCPNFLQIRKPSARRPVICVAHVVSRNRLFAAYFTCFCHNVQKFLSFTCLISILKYAKFPFYAILFSKLFCRILITSLRIGRFPLKTRKGDKV
jgi:hypothetical protein